MGTEREIISALIFLPSADSFRKGCCQLYVLLIHLGRVVVSYMLKRKYMYEVLVNSLFNVVKEKCVVR